MGSESKKSNTYAICFFWGGGAGGGGEQVVLLKVIKNEYFLEETGSGERTPR